MTARADRLALAALVLLVLTGLVTVGSALAPRRVDPCADPERMLDPLAIDPRSEPLADSEWKPLSDGEGVRKGTIPSGRAKGPEFRFMLQRVWGLPNHLQNPAKAISGRLEADRIEERWIEVDGLRIPVQVADQTARNTSYFAMYTYAYDGRPVEGVFGTRVLSLLHELWNGSRPVTLMGISGRVSQFQLDKAEARAEEWLRAAWTHYLDACAIEPGMKGRPGGLPDGS